MERLFYSFECKDKGLFPNNELFPMTCKSSYANYFLQGLNGFLYT